jgi:hypothetical protein
MLGPRWPGRYTGYHPVVERLGGETWPSSNRGAYLHAHGAGHEWLRLRLWKQRPACDPRSAAAEPIGRHRDDRGTLFGAASGMIAVLALPRSGEAPHLWDDRPPQGTFMVIEMDKVEERFQRINQKGLPIKQKLKDQAWGHRSFCICDPKWSQTIFLQGDRKSMRNTASSSLRAG